MATTSTIAGDILRLLHEYGCKDICIGEVTIVNEEMGSNTFKGYDWSGIGRIAKTYGVKLVDFNAEPFETVQLDEVKAKISKVVLETDFLINLPVLKTHRQTKVSLGMKNLKGSLALNSKKRFHKHNLNRLIVLLNTKVKTHLVIIDGIYTLEGGPDFLGRAHRANLIVAGKDVLACDVVGSVVMGINPEEVEYLKEFASIQKRPLSLDSIDVRGENVENVARKLEWRLCYEDIFHEAGIRGITVQDPGDACCSGCAAILSAFFGVFCKDNPGVVSDSVEVCIGSHVKANNASRKVFLMGDCAISANKDVHDARKIKGCPPPILDTVMALTRGGSSRSEGGEDIDVQTDK
ncbi:MAG TPA: DUF362 domain-containing protein [Syntrophales bacterium]|nr:DUF362 domain-containing protein [Syntrophales bacterium]